MKQPVWYRNYEYLRSECLRRRDQFTNECKALGAEPSRVLHEARLAIVARIVHESNWQEGIHLGIARTQELAEAAIDPFDSIRGPHLDIEGVVNKHQIDVLALKRRGASMEEIAAYNLSRAHWALRLVGIELSMRQAASLVQALKGIQDTIPSHQRDAVFEQQPVLEKGFRLVDRVLAGNNSPYGPLTGQTTTEGELVSELIRLDPEVLLKPMRIEYLHLLHRLTLLGIIPMSKCGRFRSTLVHVGNPDIIFPFPSMVPGLMEEYCKTFPTILPTTVQYDPIKTAASASHRFVSIHPYNDGNGRISRLIMNLILWEHFPPVYLKADKKGRHRYIWSLRRADRGQLEPLACLIAMSINATYDDLTRMMRKCLN